MLVYDNLKLKMQLTLHGTELQKQQYESIHMNVDLKLCKDGGDTVGQKRKKVHELKCSGLHLVKSIVLTG